MCIRDSSYAGPEQFASFLSRTDLLVCLLPATEATRGILNRDTFACLVYTSRCV